MDRWIFSREYGVEVVNFDGEPFGLGDVADWRTSTCVAVLKPRIYRAPHRWSDIEAVWCPTCGWLEEDFRHEPGCIQDPNSVFPLS
jgi:hypothetical protein